MWTRVLSSFVLVLGFLINTPAMSARSSDEAAVAQAVDSLRKAALSKDRGQFDCCSLTNEVRDLSQERDSDGV